MYLRHTGMHALLSKDMFQNPREMYLYLIFKFFDDTWACITSIFGQITCITWKRPIYSLPHHTRAYSLLIQLCIPNFIPNKFSHIISQSKQKTKITLNIPMGVTCYHSFFLRNPNLKNNLITTTKNFHLKEEILFLSKYFR